MSINLIGRWLLLRPVLQRVIKEIEEEMVHQGANIIILGGGFMIGLLFLLLRR